MKSQHDAVWKDLRIKYLMRDKNSEYIEFQKLEKKKNLKNCSRRWLKEVSRRFCEEDKLMAHKYMKRYSTLLTIRKPKIEITMKHWLTFSMRASRTQQERMDFYEKVECLWSPSIVSRNGNGQQLWKRFVKQNYAIVMALRNSICSCLP